MSIYKKISKMSGNESYDEKLYKLLNTPKYNTHIYETCQAGEGMAVIHECIWGWWKPRFILNHNTKCAYEFMDGDEYLVTVTENDIDWDSLKKLPEDAQERARALSFHFPSFIRGFVNGVSMVSWQLNPDGRYYMDDDGFGMTSDREIEIYGFIDQKAEVVVKFRYINDDSELDKMRKEAEEIVKDKKI